MSDRTLSFPVWSLLITLVLVVAGVVLMAVWVVKHDAKSCRERWAASGMQARAEGAAGCRVEVKPGIWIPERNVKIS